jgi:RNA polymerase sigma-70 factor (ECF subfamily)
MAMSPLADLDAQILEGCRRGDPGAQRHVYDHYQERVFSIALHYFRGDDAAAQDVTQEVFVKVFRTVQTFRQDARFASWLYRIVANSCIDELRRRRRFVLFGDAPKGLEPSTPAPEVAELDADVATALGRLSPKLRIAVLLRYFDDLSYDEIARALETTPGTVASRLNRAHAILARELRHRAPAGRTPSHEPSDDRDA